jgi:hypothetical protein
MATRKYKKQRKGNLKKKSLGKKKRSMKKRGKSLKKRGGNGDLLIKPLTVTFRGIEQEVTLPWAEYVNPLYKFLKDLQSEGQNIAEMYKTRINEIYNRDNEKSLLLNFERLAEYFPRENIGNTISLKPCTGIRDKLSNVLFNRNIEQKPYKLIVCQAIKIRIYNDIMRQIKNIQKTNIDANKKISQLNEQISQLEKKNKTNILNEQISQLEKENKTNILNEQISQLEKEKKIVEEGYLKKVKPYFYTNIPEMQNKNVKPVVDTFIFNQRILDNEYMGIKRKFQKHVDEFIKIGGIEKYTDDIIQEILNEQILDKETVKRFAKLKTENDESYNTVQDVTATYSEENPNIKRENTMPPPLSTTDE